MSSTLRVSPTLPKPGESIAGKYTLRRVLGQGSMAVVFEATHERLRQKVAIKVLQPRFAEYAETLVRFEREARAVVQLRGRNVARVIDVDTTEGGLPYIVMEYLEGKDLAAEMSARGQLPIEDAVRWILQACSAMHEAHALGIVHRDLKPANLFLCGEGEHRHVKVLDFGISKLLDGDTHLTDTNVVLGTPVYMSPEQIEAAKRVDPRTDIWSLGVILYEMLACELPFDGANALVAVRSITTQAPKPLASRRPDAPAPLIDAVMRALAKDPEERWPDVTALANAIAPFGPAPGTWSPPDLSAPSQRPPPSRARPSASIALRAAARAADTQDDPADAAPAPAAAAPTVVRDQGTRVDRQLLWLALVGLALLVAVVLYALRG